MGKSAESIALGGFDFCAGTECEVRDSLFRKDGLDRLIRVDRKF